MNQLFIPKNNLQVRALDVATFGHEGQLRKGSKLPYIIHPIEVANILAMHGSNSDAIIAGLLHDILEDVDPSRYSEADMRREFGDRITDIVLTVSKPNKSTGNWRYRNDVYLGQIATTPLIEAVEVCAADKLSNITATLEDYKAQGDGVWANFNAGKEQQQWWYSAVYDTCEARIPQNPIIPLLGEKVLLLTSL